MEEVTLGIIFGIIAMFGHGLSNAISKIPAKKLGPIKTTFFRGFFVTIFLLIFLFFVIDKVAISFWHIALVIILSIIGYIPLISFYKGLTLNKVGIIAPIASSSVIITIILSLIFFKESLNSMQVSAILLIIIGIILLSVDLKHFKKSDIFKLKSGIPYALITFALWGVLFFMLKIPILVIGPVLTALILEGGITVWSGLHMKKRKQSFRLKKNIILHIILMAITGAIGTLCFNIGVMHADVSIVAPIASAAALISALYGKVIYNEHLKSKQWLAIVLIITGIILISL